MFCHKRVSMEANDIVLQENATEKHSESDAAFSSSYVKLIVKNPKIAFGIGIGSHIFLILLTCILAISGYDIIPVNFAELPLSLDEDSSKLRTDAWWHVHEDKSVTPSSSIMQGQRERSVLYQPLEVIYELKEGNVFTRENLLRIKATEGEIFNITAFQSQLCQLTDNINQTCKPPLSVLRFFDGTYQKVHPIFYDPDFNNIEAVLTTAKDIKSMSVVLSYHLSKEAVVNKNESLATSKYTRSLFYFGWPTEGFKSTDDREDEQKKSIDEAIYNTFTDLLDEKYKNKIGDMNFYYFNFALMGKSIEKQVIWDMSLAVGSFAFIFLFMWLQTGSLWLTSWGIFGIISSFNVTCILYRIVFDYRYFGIFHVLSIFIILGIGSDNIFVFVDTWKEHGKKNTSLTERLSHVYKSAAKATLITSFTTTIAFLSNVSSPLLAVSSFGLFSAILVTVNYLSCRFFMPIVLIIHEEYRQGRCCCCELMKLNCRQKNSESPVEMDLESAERTDEKQNSPDNFVIRFLEGWFYRNIIAHKVIRWVVLVFFLVLVATFLGFAVQLGPDEEQVAIWGPNTNWGKIRDLRKNAFSTSQEDKVVVVHIIWGLKDQDRSSCHHTDFKCKGKTVFDKSFDLNPPPCQNAMLELCKKIRNLPEHQEKNLRLRRDGITGEIEMQCVFERMDEWLKEESKKTKYKNGSDFNLPVTSKSILPLMEANPNLYDVSVLPETYYRYFEVALSFFLFDGRSMEYANNYDFQVYSKLAGGALDKSLTTNGTSVMQGAKYGHRLLYLAIALNTSVQPEDLGYDIGLTIYNDWEDFVNNQMNEMPSSCNNGFQATVEHGNIWHWLKVQRILVRSAITGILIGLFSSAVVLVIATTNLIVGMLASLTITLITCTILGTVNILGWKLGVLESLNLTLVVGLAVDYVVHLAEGYMELKHENRLMRVHHTLRHVGISVLSGACTTLGASMFLLGAKIVFFFQFGIFIFCTIGFSIAFSLFFFTTLLGLIGPQEDEKGSIIPAVTYIKEYAQGRRKGDVLCTTCQGKGFISRK